MSEQKREGQPAEMHCQHSSDSTNVDDASQFAGRPYSFELDYPEEKLLGYEERKPSNRVKQLLLHGCDSQIIPTNDSDVH